MTATVIAVTPQVEAARQQALAKARAQESGRLVQEPGDLDLVHKDKLTSISYKIVFEEKVQVSIEYERRIGVEESTPLIGPVTYRVITATCDVGSKAPPNWRPRSNWKESYDDVQALAHSLYEWNCDYARSAGFTPPHEVI